MSVAEVVSMAMAKLLVVMFEGDRTYVVGDKSIASD